MAKKVAKSLNRNNKRLQSTYVGKPNHMQLQGHLKRSKEFNPRPVC